MSSYRLRALPDEQRVAVGRLHEQRVAAAALATTKGSILAAELVPNRAVADGIRLAKRCQESTHDRSGECRQRAGSCSWRIAPPANRLIILMWLTLPSTVPELQERVSSFRIGW
jgi:hypothetical protein